MARGVSSPYGNLKLNATQKGEEDPIECIQKLKIEH
jgi:hypothetical protein